MNQIYRLITDENRAIRLEAAVFIKQNVLVEKKSSRKSKKGNAFQTLKFIEDSIRRSLPTESYFESHFGKYTDTGHSELRRGCSLVDFLKIQKEYPHSIILSKEK